MLGKRRLTRFVLRWLAPVTGLAALGVALFLYFHTPAPKSFALRVTAGNELGMRHQLALRLQKEATDRNVDFKLTPSAGKLKYEVRDSKPVLVKLPEWI
jgi:hypothetical protein